MTLRSLPTQSILTLAVASFSAVPALAVPLYWNPAPLTETWDTTRPLFATTPGGLPDTVWTDVATNDANFDRPAVYTVTPDANRTAGLLTVSAGDVTFGSTFTISNIGTTVGTGATLTSGADRILKAGTTALTVDGTLRLSGGAAGGRLAAIGGSGVITAGTAAGAGLRLGTGTYAFAGSLRDFDTALPVTDATRGRVGLNGNGAAYNLTLSGDNSGATGTFVVSAGAATRLRLLNANAIGPNAAMTLGNGTNSGLIELGAADFTRVYAAAADGNGGITWGGANAGFYATGVDRNLTFVSAVGGAATDVTFGVNGLTATGVVLSEAAATNKLTWTNNVNLGAAASTTRTMVVGDGAAAVDAELSGVISGTTLTANLGKSGAGRLVVSNANTFLGNVVMSGAGVPVGFLRPTNNEAFGPDAAVKNVDLTGSTGNSTGGVELTGGLTINNKNLRLGGRQVSGTVPVNAGLAALINVSGDNAWNGTVLIGGGGGGYALRSDAGTLTLGGAVANEVANSNRTFNFYGAGNFNVTGQIRNGAGTAAVTGVTQAGTGTTTLNGNDNYTGTTVVQAGTLRATVAAYTNTVLGSGTGGLDVQGGKFVFVYADSGSPVLQVKSILTAGYNQTPAKFATGAIRSTTLATGPAGRIVGYADNPAQGTVTVAVTLPGDANLDGAVSFDDFVLLQGSFNQTGVTFGQGDFDYNDAVNFDDFVLLQGNFGQTTTGGRAAFTREQYAAVMSITNAGQVPEPAMLSVLGLGATGLLRRRAR